MNSVNIYIDEKRISFLSTSEEKEGISLSDRNLHCHFTDTKKIPKLFSRLINEEQIETLTIYGPPSKALKAFASRFSVIEAAGGLIKNARNEYLFIYRNQKWDLPKGKIDPDDKTIKSAAVRECVEECGIPEPEVLDKLPPTYHMYNAVDRKFVLKKTHWFLMYLKDAPKLVPQKEEGISKVEWINKEGLKKVLRNTYPSIKDVLLATGI